MRPRRLFAFLAIAALLGAYYAFVEVPRKARQDRALRAEAALSDFAPDRVSGVHISRAGADLVFVLNGTQWEMTSPLADIADQSAVGRLIASVAEARIERRLAQGDNLSAYGLADPVARVDFVSDRRDTLFAIALGDNTIDNAFAYATTDGHTVLMIPTAVRRYALAAVEDFRNKRAVSFDMADITAFTVTSDHSRMRWFRRAEGQWAAVVGGDTVRGDAQAVEGVLRRLRGLRARGFAPTGAVDFSTAPSLVLETTGRDSLRLHIATTSRGVFSRVEGETRVVEVDSTALRLFTHAIADLRDHRVLRVARERVTRVTLTTPDTSATFVRAGDGWGSPNPVLGTFSRRAVERFWRFLDGLAYETIARSEPLPSATTLGGESTLSLALYGRGDTILDIMWCRPDTVSTAAVHATSRSSRVLGTIAQRDIDMLIRLVRELRSH